MKRTLQHAGSLPRISPSALPVLPRIPGPHLCFPPSLNGVGEVLSSWGVLVEAQGLLPSPRSQHCKAGQSAEVPEQFVHSLIQSPPHSWPRSRQYWEQSDGTTSGPVLMFSSPMEYRSVTRRGNPVWSGLA